MSFVDPRLTEQRNPRSTGIDVASSLEIVALMNDEDRRAVEAVRACRREIAGAIDLVVAAFRRGGRLIYVGAGTSGRLGVLDASECPPTFGTDPDLVVGIIAGGLPALTRSQEGAEDDRAAGAEAIDGAGVSDRDVVFGIAASGSTPYVHAALARAHHLGAGTVFFSCTAPPPSLDRIWDVAITPLVGPEVLTGSTRLKAGTATKLVLNTVTTGAMVRLGKAYGNLMVDLQAWSEKLVDRGERIVMETTGVDRERARQAIEAAEGHVKLAIVMAATGLDAGEARRRLDEAEGSIRGVVGDPPPISE